MSSIGNLQKDYLLSCIRYQLITLKEVLYNIENCSLLDEEYISQSLTSIEKQMRKMKKIYLSN